MDNNMKRFTTPGKVKQVNATVLAPELAGLRVILNFCSQDGKFEQKLDKLLTKKWANVRTAYKEWHATQNNFKMGLLHTTPVMSDVWICEALVRDKNGKLDPEALKKAVKELAKFVRYEKASLHVSSMLTDEAPELREMLLTQLVEEGSNVFFYTEPSNK